METILHRVKNIEKDLEILYKNWYKYNWLKYEIAINQVSISTAFNKQPIYFVLRNKTISYDWFNSLNKDWFWYWNNPRTDAIESLFMEYWKFMQYYNEWYLNIILKYFWIK